MKARVRIWVRRHLGAFALLVLVSIAFWSSRALQDLLFGGADVLQQWLRSRPVLGPVVFVMLAAASAMLSLFSSVPIVPLAVLLWGRTGTFVLLLTGWMIGGAAAYWIGAALHRWLERLRIYPRIRFYRDRLRGRRIELGIVVLFRLAMPAEVPGYVLGLLRYNFGKYLFATFVSELPVALGTVWASEMFLERRVPLLLAGAAVAVLALAVAFELFHRRLAPRDGQDPGTEGPAAAPVPGSRSTVSR